MDCWITIEHDCGMLKQNKGWVCTIIAFQEGLLIFLELCTLCAHTGYMADQAKSHLPFGIHSQH